MQDVDSEELVLRSESCMQEKRWEESIRVHHELLRRNPGSVDLWLKLGKSYLSNRQVEQAVQTLRKAVELHPQSFTTWLLLGNAYAEAGRLHSAGKCVSKSLAIQESAKGWELLATIQLFAGDTAASEASARQALKLGPADARVKLTLALALLKQEKFSEGWELYQSRFEVVPTNWEIFKAQLWEGECLNGKTIMVLGEQGLGDTLQFARSGRVLKSRYPECKVWFFAQEGLLPLLRSAPGFDALHGNQKPPPSCDFYVPAMSLPVYVDFESDRSEGHEQAYLEAKSALKQRWRDWFERNTLTDQQVVPKIGLAWRGNSEHRGDKFRSLRAEDLRSLGIWEQVAFFSLQRDASEAELATLQPWLQVAAIPDLDKEGGLFEDSAAILSELDLLITVDTALAHLAGALGVPVWLVLGKGSDWRWGENGSETRLYPSMRLFRQQEVGRWQELIAHVANALSDEYANLKRRLPESYRIATSGNQQTFAAKHGYFSFCSNDAYVGRSIQQYGEWSEPEVQLFRKLVSQDAVVIEAGANIGTHTIPLAQIVGNSGRVYALEPQARIFRNLCANISLNGLENVTAYQAAIGSQPGRVFYPLIDSAKEFNFSGLAMFSDEEAQRFRLRHPQMRLEEVEQRTVDSLRLQRCDLIKADVQGAELALVEGAQETIQRCKPLLYMEYEVDVPDLVLRLQYLDYELYWHLPSQYSSDNFFGNPKNCFEGIYSRNILAVPRSRRLNIQGLARVELTSEQENNS